MKVLFLEIDTSSTWALASVGPACIASSIRNEGHDASLLRMDANAAPELFAESIAQESPDLLAVSLTARQWGRAREAAAAARSALDIPLIAGGLLATFAPEQVLCSEGFDYACIGEGEFAMLDLLDALSGDECDRPIDNIWRRGGARPGQRAPVADLDSLPFMARDLLDEQHGVAHMVTGRGCPFTCAYCSARSQNDLYGGHMYQRRRSVDNVIEEMRSIAAAGALNYIIFLDDTFTAHRTWVEEFCDKHPRAIGVGFSIHARADTVTADMIKSLSRAGCRHVVYGVESGSPRVRREIMNRDISDEAIVEAFALTKEAGILATANYMFGLPGETRENVEATLALNARLAPDDFGWFVYHPYPGTPLHEYCREQGYLPADHLLHPADNRSSVLNLPDLSRSDIEEFCRRFEAARRKPSRAVTREEVD